MKIETKIAINDIKKHIKRTIFTSISIILCTTLICISALIIFNIKNGIDENMKKESTDYHFVIKGMTMSSYNRIKEKDYIDTIYTKNEQIDNTNKINEYSDTVTLYIKYKDVKKTCEYTTDVIRTLGLEYKNIEKGLNECKFNQKLLMLYGLIDVDVMENDDLVICTARVNFSYAINIIIVVIFIIYSMLFVVILYNAFLITINERLREYSTLNSVGTTEWQLLKILFIELLLISVISITVGIFIAIACTNIIIQNLNQILINTGYEFNLVIDLKCIILVVSIILFNIYIAALIPGIKASSSSVIQNIRNNKQIKHRNNIMLERFFSIEGKLAIKNIRINRNKYKIITILLVVCIVSYITVSTYINYEKATADLATQYDVDAELGFEKNLNYRNILKTYEINYNDPVQYMEYKIMGIDTLIEPEDLILTNQAVTKYNNGKKSIQIAIVGLDNNTYNKYINKLNEKNKKVIIYNTVREIDINEEMTYIYYTAFENERELKISIINSFMSEEESKYDLIDEKELSEEIVLTDNLPDGYKELKTKYRSPIVFVDMDKYNEIESKIYDYNKKSNHTLYKWIISDADFTTIKIKCNNIIKFSNYIENINQKQDMQIDAQYYSLENKEKIIYIKTLELALNVITILIVIIGIASTTNIINASLNERKHDFKILHDLGANRTDINKILIYECMYIFFKAIIISIILSIPILYAIIKYMENIIVLNKLLIPFENISIFLIIILAISLSITMYSTKNIREK